MKREGRKASLRCAIYTRVSTENGLEQEFKDLLGLLVGDRVKAKRIERIEMLWRQTRERLGDRGVADPEAPSLKYAIPILEAAADEENEELQDLWSRLLLLRWTRTDATRCVSPSFRLSSKWTRWTPSFSRRSRAIFRRRLIAKR